MAMCFECARAAASPCRFGYRIRGCMGTMYIIIILLIIAIIMILILIIRFPVIGLNR